MTDPGYNPHFDDGLLVWDDSYSGRFMPPPSGYYAQFDEKWRIVLEKLEPAGGGLGYRTDDESVSRLVYEWTGNWPADAPVPATLPARQLREHVDPALIAGKKCLDAGCGSGRWTRVLQRLGAREVLSVDISEHSLQSTSRYNANVLRADLSCLCSDHPELRETFDFVNLWGVAHHTHDPRQTFFTVAEAVKPGGALFLMLYDPSGMHNTLLTNHLRKRFNRMKTPEDRTEFADAIAQQRWHLSIPLGENLRNMARRGAGRARRTERIGVLDMLMPWYNWTVPADLATGWMQEAGFSKVTVMNPGGKVGGRQYLAIGKRA